MGRIAADTSVFVAGAVYLGGDEVPAEHAALITNPACWEDGVVPEPGAKPTRGRAKPAPEAPAEGEQPADEQAADAGADAPAE